MTDIDIFKLKQIYTTYTYLLPAANTNYAKKQTETPAFLH